MMELIVLGSGTCVPSLKRNAPGYFLEADGCRVLVDCGSGTLLQLEKAAKSYRDIDAVFITHRHPDHFADLMPLIHALHATPGFTRDKDLFIAAPYTFHSYYADAVGPVLGRPREFKIDLIEAAGKMDYGPFHIMTAKTVHAPDSIAYRFEHGDTSIVFTGDADYDEGIVELARGTDLLVADCSFPGTMKANGHMSARECGLVAEKAGAKRLLLSHLYPSGAPEIERVAESREVFRGEVLLAEDLMEIDI